MLSLAEGSDNYINIVNYCEEHNLLLSQCPIIVSNNGLSNDGDIIENYK